MSLLPTPLIAAPPRLCYMPCSRCLTLALPRMWFLCVKGDPLHYFIMTSRHGSTELQQVKQEELVSKFFWSSSAHRNCCRYYATRCQV